MDDSILIKKHHKDVPIQYPQNCLPMTLFEYMGAREDANDLYDDPDLTEYKKEGFGISRLESLEVPQRLVRGIVKYRGEEYIFTARVDMMAIGFNKLNMAKLLAAVTSRITDGKV